MMLFNNRPIDNKEYSEDILNHGLSIYEVCRVFRGNVIFLNDNLLRLDNSIKKSGLDNRRLDNLARGRKTEAFD